MTKGEAKKSRELNKQIFTEIVLKSSLRNNYLVTNFLSSLLLCQMVTGISSQIIKKIEVLLPTHRYLYEV